MLRRHGPGIAILALTGSAHGATIRVPADHATIQGAIEAAVDGDQVMISPGTYVEWEIDFLGKAITVSSLDPDDPAVVDSTIVDGSQEGPVFIFRRMEGRETRLEGVTVTGGQVDYGCGIKCLGTSPTVVSCSIRDNDSWRDWVPWDRCGGGVYCQGGAPLFIDCRTTDNWIRTGYDNSLSSDAYGGGICAKGGAPVLVGCEIRGNYAGGGTTGPALAAGGGVALFDGARAELQDCLIAENTAAADYFMGDWGRGAGIHGEDSSLELIRCELVDNELFNKGLVGGIHFVDGRKLRLVDCTLSDNDRNGIVARTDTLEVLDSRISGHTGSGYYDELGGGIDWDGDYARIIGSDIVNNRTYRDGGGLLLRGDALIEECTIRGNTSSYDGGGIYTTGDITIRSCVIDSNKAYYSVDGNGGGICVRDAGSVLAEDCTLRYNWAHVQGGGVYADAAGVTLVRCRLLDNAAIRGGAAYVEAGPMIVAQCDTRGNTVTGSGASTFEVEGGSLEIDGTIIAENGAIEWGHADPTTLELRGGSATLTNCTIANNLSETAVFQVYQDGILTIENSIIWGNDSPQVSDGGGDIQIDYSDITGGWPGTGNIDADPLFRSFGGYDYLLGVGSPVIDAGDPALSDAVFDSHPRWPQWHADGERCDMGAYGGPGNREWLPWRSWRRYRPVLFDRPPF